MENQTFKIELSLPKWISEFLSGQPTTYNPIESRMELAIELSRRNIVHGTGGPFGAAVFDSDTGQLIAPGVNLVTHTQCCLWHAEMVALALAHKITGSYDLGSSGRNLELVSSCEPCAMCMGTVPWSGVKRLVCGARHEDASSAGFNEGAKPKYWSEELKKRGIEVIVDISRDAARQVLIDYKTQGGIIY